MRILLDTHTFIWWDSDPAKLSLRAITLCSAGFSGDCEVQAAKGHQKTVLPDRLLILYNYAIRIALPIGKQKPIFVNDL
jgi:hypothetical protein